MKCVKDIELYILMLQFGGITICKKRMNKWDSSCKKIYSYLISKLEKAQNNGDVKEYNRTKSLVWKLLESL